LSTVLRIKFVMDKNSYLMLDQDGNDNIKMDISSSNELVILPKFFSLDDVYLEEVDRKCADIRSHLLPLLATKEQEVGENMEFGYKYIAHQVGRYDVWFFYKYDFLKVLNDKQIHLPAYCRQQSVGLLLLEPRTMTDGKWHQDAVPLFPTPIKVPPYYYTLLIALDDLTPENGATQFYLPKLTVADGERPIQLVKATINHDNFCNDDVYWLPLKRGDAVLFAGSVWHRGVADLTDEKRDLLYVVFAPKWYNEEKM